MDFKLLKSFVSVAKNSSFTEAAKELFIAQSAVSKQISTLEKELGVQLLLRDNRTVRLTSYGETFFIDACDILNRIDSSISKMKKAADEINGSLTLGTFSIIASDISLMVKEFRHFYPNALISLDWYDFDDVTAEVEAGNIDIGFTLAFQLSDKPNLCNKTILPGILYAVFSSDHPLSDRKELHLSELAEIPFFTMKPKNTPNGYMAMREYFEAHQFQPIDWRNHESHESMLLQLQIHNAYSLLADHQFRGHPGLAFVPLVKEEQPNHKKYDLVAVWSQQNKNPCIPLFLQLSDDRFHKA